MLKKVFLFLLVFLFSGFSQASYIEDYVDNLFQSAINKSIRSSSYFLSEIDRLENAGADFVHSERMCRLKHLENLFDIDPSLDAEKPFIQRTIDEIDHNNIGQRLINMLSSLLEHYPVRIFNELIEKKCIDSDEEDKLYTLKSYNLNRIYLYKSAKTNFSIPKIIQKNGKYAWSSEDNKKNFLLKMELRDCSGTNISMLSLSNVDSEIDVLSPFFMIFSHELIHAIDFLYQPQQYRQNNIYKWDDIKSFETAIDILWPSLYQENDGFKLGKVWDYRITELRAVVGSEKLDEHSLVPSLSEMTFGIAENCIRFPYVNVKTTISGKTKEVLSSSGKQHLKRILDQNIL